MEGKRYDTKDFIYVSAPVQRFSRTRPIPPFVQVFTSIWRFDDILNSEAVSWQLLAMNAYIVTKR